MVRVVVVILHLQLASRMGMLQRAIIVRPLLHMLTVLIPPTPRYITQLLAFYMDFAWLSRYRTESRVAVTILPLQQNATEPRVLMLALHVCTDDLT